MAGSDRGSWRWQALIMQPDPIDAELIAAATAQAASKKDLPGLAAWSTYGGRRAGALSCCTSGRTPPKRRRSRHCTRPSPKQATAPAAATTRSTSATRAAARRRSCGRSSGILSSRWGPGMTKITGEIVIGAPAEVVFDFVADRERAGVQPAHGAIGEGHAGTGWEGHPVPLGGQVRGPGCRDDHRVHRLPAAIPGWPRPRRWPRPSSAGRSRSSGWRWHAAAVVMGRPVHLAAAGCWHRSWPGWADGRNERRGQGSSGTWSPPRPRRAPAPGSSPAPHPPRLRTGTAASRPGQGRAGAACKPRAWPRWRSPRLRCGGSAAAAACWSQPAAGRYSPAMPR